MQIDYVKILCKEDVHICHTNFAKKMERNLYETTSRWKKYGKWLFFEDLKIRDVVLENLRERGFYAKQEKCLFHQSMVEFLGYIVSGDGISMDEKKNYKLLLIGLHLLFVVNLYWLILFIFKF
jgi:hypothetical protein